MIGRPFGAVLMLMLMLIGCGPAAVHEERIPVKTDSPLSEPRSILERYAEGQPPGSEVAGFADMVAAVRNEDPVRADILEKGLADVRAASASERPAKAKRILEELNAASP